jgi:hypothetical protein
MPCYYPMRGFRKKRANENGKRPVVFNGREGDIDEEVIIACGKCIGCRLENSKVKAIRAMHESDCHDCNCFITLTYDNDNLPGDGSLVKEDFQNFMKNLRYRLVPKNPYSPRTPENVTVEEVEENRKNFDTWQFENGIRYMMCGEYGQDQDLLVEGIDALGRPHYHAILFNFNPIIQALMVPVIDPGTTQECFDELYPVDTRFGYVGRVENSRSGDKQYLSSVIQQSWGKGRTRVSHMSFEAAAYVARYVTKKIDKGVTPEQEQAYYEHYSKFDEDTGLIHLVLPEYSDTSRNPGLGAVWYDRYKSDLLKGFISVNGIEMSIPRYYMDRLANDAEFSGYVDDIKLKSKEFIARCGDKYDSERLRDSEHIKRKQLNQLKREL